MKTIPITSIEGVRIGQVSDHDNLTGCTVLFCPSGAVGGVSVRGGAPGTRETDALHPSRLVSEVHAIFLTGGSAYGLRVADGIMDYLEEQEIGFETEAARVPIVSGAVIYDLNEGAPHVRPDAAMGRLACERVSNAFDVGRYGAGTGATIGKVRGKEGQMNGGIGAAACQIGDVKMGAVVAVNCFGDVFHPLTGKRLAGVTGEQSVEDILLSGNIPDQKRENTTIGVIVTNASLSKEESTKLADIGHNGFARTIRPVHTMVDGDTLFSMATGAVKDYSFLQLSVLAVKVVEEAVISAVIAANDLDLSE
ncbi:P1 family peptidase [Bacillaceae bacterium SIJ1]|uniref:P1 family peptidase n=1 Tax=Litoribacterium kuwaitense TaxID=1398745 RepID=UPI0013ECB67F|nr:P1 family peptidase [Litoribacterium kuwaitense]NGP43980.1 P1 family peptidase [Litoribacterium kuwaitense]